MRKFTLIMVSLAILIVALGYTSCTTQNPGFAIYLADTGEVLLKNSDIEAFLSTENAFILNDGGVKRWNSFSTSTGSANIVLYNRDFVMKIGNEEICRGKIWSMLSSSSYEGIGLWGFIFPDGENSYIRLQEWDYGLLDSTVRSKIVEHFSGQHKLKTDY